MHNSHMLLFLKCSALKENHSLSLTVLGCLDQVLLVLLYMVPFLTTITSSAR